MLAINSNYAASFAANAAKQSQSGFNGSMEKLSTGKRINYARDDAAGQAISMRLSAEVQGLTMASRNAADAQSLIDTAEGALKETHSILLRIRELSVNAINGTLVFSDRDALDNEAKQLFIEVERIAVTTTWAGVKILDGSGNFSFQIGVNNSSNDRISLNIADMGSHELYLTTDNSGDGRYGAGDSSHGLEHAAWAQSLLNSVDSGISKVSTERGKLGAISNRLKSTITNLDQIAVHISASKGRIEDVDFAIETGNLAKQQILQQAATSMVAQANTDKSSILALLRG